MGNFDRGNRGGGRSFGKRNFAGGSDRRGADRGRGGFAGGDRTMHHAVCNNCGRDCEVPFLPTGSKPVYCSDCFEKMNNNRGTSQSGRSNLQAPSTDKNKGQLEAMNLKLETMNAKLEKILKILVPEKAVTSEVIATPVSVGDAIKKAKPLKLKKEIKKSASSKK